MSHVTASLVVVGDEILDGHVDDVNTGVLARALRAVGVPLLRTHTVGDDRDAIVDAVRTETARSRPHLVVTSGGIGSTPDDITLAAVAAALDRGVERNLVVASRLEDVLAGQRRMGIEIGPEVVEPMMRMADLPAGARLLEVSGWVPAVVVDLDRGVAADGTTVAILPGVPSAFAHIVDEGLVPMVSGRNPAPAVVEVTHGLPESLLNPVFAEVGRAFPDVKLGSYPGRPMLVRLSGPAERADAAAQLVGDHLDRLLATDGGRRLARRWSGRERVAMRSSEQAMAGPVGRRDAADVSIDDPPVDHPVDPTDDPTVDPTDDPTKDPT